MSRFGRARGPQRVTKVQMGSARVRRRRGYPALGDPRTPPGLLSARARLRQSPGRGRSSRGPIGPRSIPLRLARRLRRRPRHSRAGLTSRLGRTLRASAPALRAGPYAQRCARRQSRPACAVLLRNSYYVALGKETERKVREETGLINNKQTHHTKRLLGKLEYEARKIGSNAKKSLTKLYIEYV